MKNNKPKNPENVIFMDETSINEKILNHKAPDTALPLPDSNNCILMDNIAEKISKIRDEAQNNTTIENKNKLK